MTEESQVPQGSIPTWRLRAFRRGLVAFVALTLAGLGFWYGVMPMLDLYTVEVSDAIAWEGCPSNQGFPRGTEVRLTLHNRLSQEFADAEVFIDRWTDDRGKDLLIHRVTTGPERPVQSYIVHVSDGRGSRGSSAVVVRTDERTGQSDKIEFRMSTPVDTSANASAVTVAGRVVVLRGENPSKRRVEDFAFRQGESFWLGGSQYVVVGDSSHGSVTLRKSGGPTFLRSVRVLGADGKEVPPPEPWMRHAWGLDDADKVMSQADQPVVRYESIRIPSDLKSATLEAEYWSQLRLVEVPFEATIPLVRKHTPAFFKDSPDTPVTPVSDSAWGPKGDGRAEDIFQFFGKADRRTGGRYHEFSAKFRILCLDPMTVVSYDVILTACQDDAGNNLLGGLPARSAVCEYWSLYGDGGWTTQDDRVMPKFAVTTNRLPASSAKSVTYEGMIRLKAADGPQTVELKNIEFDPNKPFNLGPVEFQFARMGKDFAIFHTRGDQGMLRDLIGENEAGKKLWHEIFGPRTYWTNTSGMSFNCPDGTKTLTIKAKYLTRQWYYDLPFKITVPLGVGQYTVMKSAPAKEQKPSSRPAGG